ncbi:MAG: alpha/beta hydrolase [Ideonella sp.]
MLRYRLITAFALGLASAIASGAESTPCRVPGIAQQIVCGSILRPLDPQRPGYSSIEIRYAIVPALARNKRPDPVLLLAGGPGQSAIALAPAVLPLLSRLNNRRDLIFVDQRGTGRSAPLECKSDTDKPISAQFDITAQRRLLAECRHALARLPYLKSEQDLRFFTTTIAMGDIDAVRRQLGIQQLNLIGASYGSRAALELMRLYPATVRRTVLDGVAPPDMALPASMSIDSQRALDAMFVSCLHAADCAATYPRLRADWDRLLASMPQTIELRDPRNGRIDTLRLDRDIVLGMVRGPLYLPIAASALPAAINAAANGRFEPLAALATMLQPRPERHQHEGIAEGMHFSVVCSEDAPRLDSSTDQAGRDFGTSMREAYRKICADWPRGAVDPAYYRIPPSTSAVLMFSGGLDPATPPRHGDDVLRQLGAKASHRVIANAGHGLLSIGCARDVVFRFVDASTDADALGVDSRCVEAIPRPPAFLPPASSAPQ